MKAEKRNNSTLSYMDCCMRLTGDHAFEEMNNDDLDSIYFVAFGRWGYHMSHEGYVNALNIRRNELNNEKQVIQERINNFYNEKNPA